MRRPRLAQDLAATLDSTLGERPDVERDVALREPKAIREGSPRPEAQFELRAPMTPESKPLARAAPDLDRRQAIADLTRDWDSEATETPASEPDNDIDDVPEKPRAKPNPEVGADVHTPDHSREERRLRIARRIGSVIEFAGGIGQIVSGARGGIAGAAAGGAFAGIGGGMREGATAREEELKADTRREETNAINAAKQLQADKHQARTDEMTAARDAINAENYRADNDRLAAELEMDAAVNEQKFGLDQFRAATDRLRAEHPRGMGGGGAGGPHRPATPPPNFTQPLPDPLQEAEAERFARQTLARPDDPIDPVVMAAARRRVVTHYQATAGMKPASLDQSERNYQLDLGARMNGAQVSSEILANRNQARSLLPLEEQGWVPRNPNFRLPDPERRAVQQRWSNTVGLVGPLKRAVNIMSRMTDDQIRDAMTGTYPDGTPQADLKTTLDLISVRYRQFAQFGVPTGDEFRRVENMFPAPGMNWPTLTQSNVGLLRSAANTLWNDGENFVRQAGFRRPNDP